VVTITDAPKSNKVYGVDHHGKQRRFFMETGDWRQICFKSWSDEGLLREGNPYVN
jgi:hypothetical protein